jgi:hypothetical protein
MVTTIIRLERTANSLAHACMPVVHNCVRINVLGCHLIYTTTVVPITYRKRMYRENVPPKKRQI